MTIQLKDGTTAEDPRLDRVYQLDWNSLNYPITAKLGVSDDASTHPPKTMHWLVGGPLDQGQDGACVGFSSAHQLLATPTAEHSDLGQPIDAKFAKEKIYWEAQKIDEWPGGAYPGASPKGDGTSVLAAAKVLKKDGIIDAYHWALNIQQLAIGVMYDGPCVFAYNWYNRMFDPDPQGFVTPGGGLAGGHATLVYGFVAIPLETSRPLTWVNLDWRRSYFEIENSWGKNWGLGGKFRMRGNVADQLLRSRGDACFYHKKQIVAA